MIVSRKAAQIEPQLSVGVVIVAAGKSRRMGGTDKLFAPVHGRPLLAHCLETFNRSELIRAVSVATSALNLPRVRRLLDDCGIMKPSSVVEGGARRQDSVARALAALRHVDIVLVHDGVRPFIDDSMIRRAVEEAREWGAATAAVPVKDTIKIAASDMTVSDTPVRTSLWAAQTPQAFTIDLLRRAHREVAYDVTDDAAMVEAIGRPVKLFMGSYDNIKVTTPEDIQVAESIARRRSQDVTA